MGRADFSFNVATHLATKRLFFVVIYGVDAKSTNLALERIHSTLEHGEREGIDGAL